MQRAFGGQLTGQAQICLSWLRVAPDHPPVHRPRPGIALPRLANTHGHGDSDRKMRGDTRHQSLLLDDCCRRRLDARQPHRERVPQPNHHVVRADRLHQPQRQLGPLRHLTHQQPPHQGLTDVEFALVQLRHEHARQQSTRVKPAANHFPGHPSRSPIGAWDVLSRLVVLADGRFQFGGPALARGLIVTVSAPRLRGAATDIVRHAHAR